MLLEFIANAGVSITLRDGRKLLVDPWVTDAFHGSWHPFPPVSESLRRKHISTPPDLIYVSHIHPDHCDVKFLRELPSDVPVLIGKLAQPHLKREIARAGFTDIRELLCDETHDLDGVAITILSQFRGTGDGLDDAVGYDIDTSLHIKDSDGVSLFHCIDNPIKPTDAVRLAEAFGAVDLALLPYSGASMYPHAFSDYDGVRKERERLALKQRRLDHFCEITRILQPRFVMPAAGSYVMGGRLAPLSRWLHQATPAEIAEAFREAGMGAVQLLQLTAGDTVAVETGSVTRHEPSPFRNFTEQMRLDYALSLSDRALPDEGVQVPPEFPVNWPRLLVRARANQWRAQERLGILPAADIHLTIRETDGVAVGANGILEATLVMDEREKIAFRPGHPSPGRYFLAFDVPASLMYLALTGGAVWNNIEGGAHLTCRRMPDDYQPTLHSLMSFFQAV